MADNTPVADPWAHLDEVQDPWATTVSEDIKKTALPSLGRGVIALGTTPSTMADLALQGYGWGARKLGLSDEWPNKAHQALEPYTYGPVVKKAEEASGGPWYNAVTPTGKMVQAGIEAVPAGVATGGEGFVPGIVRGLAAGAGSEGAGQLAEKYLPEWASPYARILGGVVSGGYGPAAARKVITPAPAEPAVTAAANTLENAGMKLTAGSKTGNPSLLQREANLGGDSVRQNDIDSFTRALTQQAGLPASTKLTPEVFRQGDRNFKDYFDTVRKSEIQPQNFAKLNNDLKTIRNTAYKGMGPEAIKDMDAFLANVKGGISGQAGGAPALSMTGPRYQYLREDLQHKINESTSATESHAWAEMRKALDQAMGKEMPTVDMAQKHAQYANNEILKNAKLENQQITPAGLHKAISKQWGEDAYNTGAGMSPLAQAGETILKRPEAKEPGNLTRVLGTALGYGASKGIGPGEGLVGGILGREALPDVVKLLTRNPITRGAYFNPLTQSYLRNQAFLPGRGTTVNPGAAIRALMGNTIGPTLEGQK